MADYRAFFQSDYLTAAEFGKRTPTFTIGAIKKMDLPNPDTGEMRSKGVIYFREIKRGLVLNRSNGQLIAAMFGNETDNWIGKGVTLHAEEVQVGTKKDLGIRVIGSPDLKAPVDAVIVLPRKKPKKVRLVPTGKGAAQAQAQDWQPPPIDADEAARIKAAERVQGEDDDQ